MEQKKLEDDNLEVYLIEAQEVKDLEDDEAIENAYLKDFGGEDSEESDTEDNLIYKHGSNEEEFKTAKGSNHNSKSNNFARLSPSKDYSSP